MSTDSPRAPTPRQLQVLEAIASETRRLGMPPTIRELGDALGISSTNGVNDILKALERKGLVCRRPGKARGIRLAGPQSDGAHAGDIDLYRAASAALRALRRGDADGARELLVEALESEVDDG